MQDQVRKTIERLRPSIQADGGDISLRGFNEKSGVVTVELVGACVGCPSSVLTLTAGIERIFKDQVPGVTAVESYQAGPQTETAVSL